LPERNGQESLLAHHLSVQAVEKRRLAIDSEGARRFSLRVMEPPKSATKEGLSDLRVQTMAGESVPLSAVMQITEEDGLASIRRINRERVVRVDVNLRGRDLVSWVEEAQAAVKKDVHLDSAYRIDGAVNSKTSNARKHA
jgi:cobalt-zinc-cadmium resistance protein CzcA